MTHLCNSNWWFILIFLAFLAWFLVMIHVLPITRPGSLLLHNREKAHKNHLFTKYHVVKKKGTKYRKNKTLWFLCMQICTRPIFISYFLTKIRKWIKNQSLTFEDLVDFSLVQVSFEFLQVLIVHEEGSETDTPEGREGSWKSDSPFWQSPLKQSIFDPFVPENTKPKLSSPPSPPLTSRWWSSEELRNPSDNIRSSEKLGTPTASTIVWSSWSSAVSPIVIFSWLFIY